MSKYRLICPECSAMVITAYLEAVVWELCPACESHRWDIYDAKMADKVIENRADSYSYKVYAS